MKSKYYALLAALSVIATGSLIMTPIRASAEEQGVEELTRGPVHEAFAETVSYDPEPGIFVRTEPPSLIEEIPPDQRPAGENVAWIPGYWGWSGEQNDFLWISGIWRNLPPGRQWVPGYWAAADSQWQWTSGYWADEETKEIAYLAKPPKSLENGPSGKAPSKNDIWISGNWVYRDDRYAWRPGYWEPGQQNWTWTPAHYQWTRRGYVFVEGYWDYSVARRGVVFAPVRFNRDVYSRPDYSYTPTTVIAAAVFVNHLFERPSYGHYYFGDYYAPKYRDEGFLSSYSERRDRRGYDAIYEQNRWENRDNRDWDRKRREDFDYYRDNENARPPATWAALRARADGDRKGRRDDFEFAQPLDRYAKDVDGRQRFQAVDRGERDRIVGQRREFLQFGKDRQRMEDRDDGKPADPSAKPGPVVREKFTKSPVIAKPSAQLQGDEAPPKRPVPQNPRLGKTEVDPKAGVAPAPGPNTNAGTSKNPDGTPAVPPATDKTSAPELGKTGKRPRPEAPVAGKEIPATGPAAEPVPTPKPEPAVERRNKKPPVPTRSKDTDPPKNPSTVPNPSPEPVKPTMPKAEKPTPDPAPPRPEPKAPPHPEKDRSRKPTPTPAPTEAAPKPPPARPEPKAPEARKEPKPTPSPQPPSAPKAEPKAPKAEPKAPKAERRDRAKKPDSPKDPEPAAR